MRMIALMAGMFGHAEPDEIPDSVITTERAMIRVVRVIHHDGLGFTFFEDAYERPDAQHIARSHELRCIAELPASEVLLVTRCDLEVICS